MEIVFDHVKKSYHHQVVLNNISFSIADKQSIGLMGKSGCGKSTLARILMTMETMDEGNILLDDISYRDLSKSQRNKIYRHIQLVFQNAHDAVNPNFSVEDVLLEALNIFYKSTISREEKDELIWENLTLLGLSGLDLKQKAHSLSGGQLQRLCIARALLLKPEILILDESLSGLDPKVQRQIIDILLNLKEKKALSYIVIAHDYSICHYLCERVLLIENGEISKDIMVEK